VQAVRQESARRAAMYACRDGSGERVPVLWRDDVTGHVTAGARLQGLSMSLCVLCVIFDTRPSSSSTCRHYGPACVSVCVCVGDGSTRWNISLKPVFEKTRATTQKRKMSRFFDFEIIFKNP